MLNYKQIAVTLDEGEVRPEASATARVNAAVMAMAGESGHGILTLSEALCRIAARLGIQSKTFPTFPPEIRGGPCNAVSRLSETQPTTHGYVYDLLIAFEQRDVDDFYPGLKPDGVLLYDSSDNVIFVRPREGQVHYGVPLKKIARDLGERRPNIVALGVLTFLLGIPYAMSEQLIRDEFGSKGSHTLNRNLNALKAGYEYAQKNITKKDPYQIEATAQEPFLLVPGNEASALGLVAAGLTRCFGYPITPSTEGFKFLLKYLPALGGRAVQLENEGASILAVIGSWLAGQKAATYTSGPGLSLMLEGLSLAYMLEVGAVVINSMRGGPSTGLPTKTEQSDLLSAIFGPHGDATNVVLAATSVEDAFYMSIAALNIATKYQTPVVLLLDQALSLGYQTMRRPNLADIHVEQIRRPSAAQLEHYKRYLRDQDGIAPMAVAGDKGGRHRTTGLEHDEFGQPSSASAVHIQMSKARKAKIGSIAQDPRFSSLGTRFGSEHPKIGIVGWGTTEGPIREAVARAMAEGIEVAAYHPRLMWPFDPQVTQFAQRVSHLIVPEQNDGQYARLIRSEALQPTIEVPDLSGLPMTPDTIYAAIVAANEGS